jgi:hypothetical protein
MLMRMKSGLKSRSTMGKWTISGWSESHEGIDGN